MAGDTTTKTEWIPPDDLDPEVLALCKAINECIPGVVTTSSCCGHGKDPFRIWVYPQSAGHDDLLPLLYRLASCHSGCYGWQMVVYTDCGMSDVSWMIEGPVGAFADSEKIAALIREDAA